MVLEREEVMVLIGRGQIRLGEDHGAVRAAHKESEE